MTKSELRRRPGQAMNMDQWRTEEATPVRMKTVLKLRCRSASVLRAPLGRVTTGAPHRSASKQSHPHQRSGRPAPASPTLRRSTPIAERRGCSHPNCSQTAVDGSGYSRLVTADTRGSYDHSASVRRPCGRRVEVGSEGSREGTGRHVIAGEEVRELLPGLHR
jgi:hypothetical protein